MVRNLYIFILLSFSFFCCAKPVAPLSVIGKWHTVKDGETVDNISKHYQSNPKMVAELNQVERDESLKTGMSLFIPMNTGSPPGDGMPSKKETITSVKTTRPRVSNTQKIHAGQCNENCFLWPVKGTIVRPFGERSGEHHDGVDIEAAKGAQVVAADDGDVLYSGDAIKGYGNLILIRHAENIITVYAHNNSNLVKEGDTVMRGQQIAFVGDSGVAQSPHLHFEIRKDEKPTNPMAYLQNKE